VAFTLFTLLPRRSIFSETHIQQNESLYVRTGARPYLGRCFGYQPTTLSCGSGQICTPVSGSYEQGSSQNGDSLIGIRRSCWRITFAPLLTKVCGVRLLPSRQTSPTPIALTPSSEIEPGLKGNVVTGGNGAPRFNCHAPGGPRR
jgi:hypothetical protein